MSAKSLLILLLCLVPALVVAEGLDPEMAGVMPGEKAPALVVSKWLRGVPVDRFEPGRIYAIDLWASWCAPCIASMPHVRRLERQYAADLTVVALNVLELMPKRVPATLASLGDSMVVTVGLDSIPAGKEANEGLMALAYLGRADLTIPRTVLIDRSGRVAWIGHPDELAEPLARVVGGTWNTDSFAKGYVARMEAEVRYHEQLERVEAEIEGGRWEEAYRACEDVAATDSTFARRIANSGFALLAMTILKTERRDEASVRTARRAAERAVEITGGGNWQLLSLAADAADASGDRAGARAYRLRAIELAPAKARASLQALVDSLATPR